MAFLNKAFTCTHLLDLHYNLTLFFRSMAYKSTFKNLGDYEIDRSPKSYLGGGGFGNVYRGKHVRTDHDVAVKEVTINDHTRKFVEREKDLMEKCEHKNIVKFFHATQIGLFLYFVLEYCTLGNLSKYFKEQTKKVPIKQCLQFMREIAQGIKHLHELRPEPVCHRDLKPSNILVQGMGGNQVCMKVADFGLARSLTESASHQSLSQNLGTTGWKAPEISHSNSSDSNKYFLPVDVFSLGLIFSSMLKHEPGLDLEPLMYKGMIIFIHLFIYVPTSWSTRHWMGKKKIIIFF